MDKEGRYTIVLVMSDNGTQVSVLLDTATGRTWRAVATAAKPLEWQAAPFNKEDPQRPKP
jgi:hypothetical protein